MLAVGPALRNDDGGFDSLAEADFIGEDDTSGERRSDGEEGRVYLVGIKGPLWRWRGMLRDARYPRWALADSGARPSIDYGTALTRRN